MAGFIYILSNPSFKENIIKIGQSKADPSEFRAADLDNTSVPLPFVTECYFYMENYKINEKKIHSKLKSFVLRNNREFFKIPVKQAVEEINQLCKNDIQLFRWIETEIKKKNPVEESYNSYVYKPPSYYRGSMYEGQWKDGKPWGNGSFQFNNGDLYKGDIVNGNMDGHGEYSFNDTSSYFGAFIENDFFGLGTWILPKYNNYGFHKHVGEFCGRDTNGNPIRNGFGVESKLIEIENGYLEQITHGQWNEEGLLNGFAFKKYKIDAYVNDFHNDFFNKLFTAVDSVQSTFLFEIYSELQYGKYAYGEKEGEWTSQYFHEKIIFNYERGEENKNFKYVFNDGNYIITDNKDILKNTRSDPQAINCKIYFNNGDIYEGNIEGSEFSGKGKYIWANKDKYIGNFIKNMPHGKGTLNSSVYGKKSSSKWEKGKLKDPLIKLQCKKIEKIVIINLLEWKHIDGKLV